MTCSAEFVVVFTARADDAAFLEGTGKLYGDASGQMVVAGACGVHIVCGARARVLAVHELGGDRLEQLGGGFAAEVEVVRVHVASDLVIKDRYVDAGKWSPLIYNFRHYFRLAEANLGMTFRAEV